MQGALELRLDEVNENWRKCQVKLCETEAEVAKRDAMIQVKSLHGAGHSSSGHGNLPQAAVCWGLQRAA